MTKKDQLQALADELRRPEQYAFLIEFRAFQGWYAIPDEPRFMEDDGEYLGARYSEAKKTLRELLQ